MDHSSDMDDLRARERRWAERAREYGVPFVDLTMHSQAAEAVALVPAEVARRWRCLPLRVQDGLLYVAMADVNRPQAADDLRMASRLPIRPVLAEPEALRRAIERAYPRPHAR